MPLDKPLFRFGSRMLTAAALASIACSLPICTGGEAAAQSRMDEEEARRLYTTTTVAFALAMPLIIYNNVTGNQRDEDALFLSSTTSDVLEFTLLTSGAEAHAEALAAAYARRHASALHAEIALGGGPVLRELRAISFGVRVDAPLDAALAQRLRARRDLLHAELVRLERGEDSRFLTELRRVLEARPSSPRP